MNQLLLSKWLSPMIDTVVFGLLIFIAGVLVGCIIAAKVVSHALDGAGIKKED